jgi:hypothetical protein
VTDTGEPIQIGRIKAKKIWIFGSFDNERVRQRDYRIIFVSDQRLSKFHGTFLLGSLLRRESLHESDDRWPVLA